MQGQIIKIVSDLHYVSCEDKVYPCKCRGIFRKEHITPVVGDYVLFSSDKNLIEKILPRKNEFERPKVSNIDQAFIITSLVNPDFSLNLLDKLLVLMELHNVEAIICITKEDLVNEENLKEIYEVLEYYKKIGYKVVSNRDLFKIKELQKVEREQVAKISGTNKDESAQNAPKRRAAAKVYPNDPCPCGSGKKYKQCCGRVK